MVRSIYGESKSLKNFDFKKFLNFLAGNNQILKIFYYNALLDKSKNQSKFKSQKEFFNKLKLVATILLHVLHERPPFI